MADDLDDLLNEVESKYCSKPTEKKLSNTSQNSNVQKSQSSYTKPTTKKRNDDIDDLINEIFDDEEDLKKGGGNAVKKGTPTTSNIQLPSKDSTKQTKCFPVFIGGSSSAQGLSTAVNQRACDSLRCTDCDFRVSCFDNVKWHSSTDYLFLRNNMPDYERLKPKLTSKKGSRAYACQCKWKSVKEMVNLQTESDLKWVCGKH